MQVELASIIEKYSKSIIQSEAEVESKLLVPLIEWLGYPSEFRAEQFPVYGFEGGKKLPAKSADFILFNDRNFAPNRTYSRKNIEWVQNHSLLIVEAKKPGEMPDVMGQAQFYTCWTKAIAYIVCDGEVIEGYYRNPISSDETILKCRVEDLPMSDDIGYFSYDRMLSIKSIDFSEEIEHRLDDQKNEKKTVRVNSEALPSELVDFIRIIMGERANGLDDGELTESYFSSMNLTQDGKYSPTDLCGNPLIRIGSESALLYLDGHIVPFARGIVSYYRYADLDRIIFENDFLVFDFICANETILSINNGFHVQDMRVSTRTYNLLRAKKTFDADRLTIKNIDGSEILDIDTNAFDKESEYYIAQEGLLDYWIDRMNQMKIIEDYYEIEFSLRPGLNAEETAELYNAVQVVYDGIAKQRNIFFEEEAEKFFAEVEPDEVLTVDCEQLSIEWRNLWIHNYEFKPSKFSLIPQGEGKVDISVEFIPQSKQ